MKNRILLITILLAPLIAFGQNFKPTTPAGSTSFTPTFRYKDSLAVDSLRRIWLSSSGKWYQISTVGISGGGGSTHLVDGSGTTAVGDSTMDLGGTLNKDAVIITGGHELDIGDGSSFLQIVPNGSSGQNMSLNSGDGSTYESVVAAGDAASNGVYMNYNNLTNSQQLKFDGSHMTFTDGLNHIGPEADVTIDTATITLTPKAYVTNEWVTRRLGGGGTTTNALTLGYGLLGTSFNGSSPITAKADSATLQTIANFFPKGDTRYYKASNPSGFITPSSTNTLTNKSGNISQWTNDSGYGTGTLSSITPGIGFTSHTPITGSGTLNVDTASTGLTTWFRVKKMITDSLTANAATIGFGLDTTGHGLKVDTAGSIVSKTFAGRYVKINSAASLLSLTLTGSGGNGFLDMPLQSVSPSAVTNHLRIYPDSLNRLSWKNSLYRRTIQVPYPSDYTIRMPYQVTGTTLEDSTHSAATYQKTLTAGTNITITGTTISATGGGGGMTNPMTTTGDIIYSSSGSTPARLAIGSATTVLHGGTTPSYSAIVNGDITNGTIDLTTKVTGTLPTSKGGTGSATAYTYGSVVYAGSGGVFGQDNPYFVWDDVHKYLGLNGTGTPTSILNINQSTGNTTGMQITGLGVLSGSPNTTTAGVGMWLYYNGTSNRQTIIGATDAISSSTLGMVRIQTGATGYANIDAITASGANRLPIVLATETSAAAVGYPSSSGPDVTKITAKLNVFNYNDAIASLKLQHFGTANGLFLDLQNSSSSSLFKISDADLWAFGGTNGTAGQVPTVNSGGTAMAWASLLSKPHTIFTPTTGGTVTLTNNQYNIINPAGAILALTVTLPSSPANNDCVFIKYTQAVTTVTYSGGTIVDGVISPAAGGLVVLTYDSGTTSWY